MSISAALNYLSAAAALTAAGLWLWSARVQVGKLSGTLNGIAPSILKLGEAVAKQSRLSAAGAVCAAVAALFQGVALLLTPANVP